MKKSLALLLAMVLSLSVAFTGCGSAPAEGSEGEQAPAEETTTGSSEEAPATTPSSTSGGKTLVWNLHTDSKTYDPGLNSAVDGSNVIAHTFEGLMRDKNDGNGQQPAMAAEMPTVEEKEDGTVVYTFKLRDAKWSDGQPVKAQDFVFAWQRVVDPMTASEYAYIMSPILNADAIMNGEKDKSELGVKAIDDKTLEVTLKQPCAYFMELCSFATLMPLREDIVGTDTEGAWAKDPAKAVSNGPFMLTEYVMSDHATLSKNPNYWNAENVKIDTIDVKMIVDEGTGLTAFKNGEVDISDQVPSEELQQLVASGECQIFPYISINFYVVNQQTKIEALQDVNVRKALSMAIDRKALVENVTRGGQKPAMGYVPYGFTDPDGNDFREKGGNYYMQETADVEAAKALLAEAGYPNGEGIPEIEIMYNTNDGLKAVAEAVQEMWKAIGVNSKLSNQEWAVFQDTRQNLTYEAVARHGWTGDYLDPQTFLDMFMTGNPQSGCGYTNPEFDKYMETALAASGKERYDAFYAAEEILMNDAYVIPLYFSTKPVIANNNKVSNWSINSLGVFWFGDADIVA